MKRFAVIFLFVFCFSTAVFSQSGRKITPTPTSEPNVEEPVYSESAPYKPRRVYPPNWNEDKNSTRKKMQTEPSANKCAENQ